MRPINIIKQPHFSLKKSSEVPCTDPDFFLNCLCVECGFFPPEVCLSASDRPAVCCCHQADPGGRAHMGPDYSSALPFRPTAHSSQGQSPVYSAQLHIWSLLGSLSYSGLELVEKYQVVTPSPFSSDKMGKPDRDFWKPGLK